MKSNPTPTPQQNHPEEKTLPAACLNDTEDKSNVEVGIISKNPSQMKIKPTPTPNPEEETLPAAYLKTKTNPGSIKIHQADKFTSKGDLKTSLMKNNLRSDHHNQTPDDKFSLEKIIKVDIPGDKQPSETLTDEEKSTKIKETPGLNNEEKLQTKEESESRSLGKSVNYIKQGQECKRLSINLRPGRLKRPG